MAHYSKLDDNNIVVDVCVVSNEEGFDGEKVFLRKFGEVYKKTSYNTSGGIHYDPQTGKPSADQSKSFRKNYGSIGFSYNEVLDAFIPPQPFPSWTLDEATCLWEAPVPRPNDGKGYVWDEDSGSWKEASAG